MKNSKITFTLALILFAGALTFTSCKKKAKSTDPIAADNESASASDNALAENTSNDAIAIGSQASENSGTLTTYKSSDPNAVHIINSSDMMLASCATITATYVSSVATSYTVDFGSPANICVGKDGRVRSGKIIYNFAGSPANAKYRTPGFKMAVSFENFLVDGNAVTGTKNITNTTPASIPQGTNPGTNITWSISANISIVKAQNGGTISWSCNRTKELTNTNDPTCYKGQTMAIDWTKAIVKLNGSASGVNKQGENYTAVANNLIRNFKCHPGANPNKSPFIGGSVDYTPGTRATRHIDYGNGVDCDFNAIVTINGQSWAITLP